MSLRARILLLVLFATLTPAVVIGVYLLGHREADVEEAKHGLSSLAKYAAENLDDKVKGTVQLLHGLSRAPDLDTRDKAACSAFLGGVLSRYPQYTGLLTIRPDGELHCDSLRSGRKLNLSARRYFRQVLTTREPAFEVVFGGLTGIAVLQVAYPVLDGRGALKHVLLASLNLSEYAQSFTAVSQYAGLRMLIWDAKGTLMVSAPAAGGEAFAGKQFAQSELFRFAQASKPGAAAEVAGLDAARRVWALGVLPEPEGAGARITLGLPRDVLVAEAEEEFREALALLCGFSLLAFIGAWLVAETGIRRHVARIAGVAARVGAGELGARIGAPYPRGELGDLMAVFDRTAGAVQAQQAEIEARSRDLQRANRTLRVLSGINSLIVRTRHRDELFGESCRVAVEEGRFRMAWIGLVDHDGMKVEPVASAGASEEYLAFIRRQFSLAEGAPGATSLVALAIRSKEVMLSNDTQADPAVRFREQHAKTGVRSIAVLPLVVSSQAVGVMVLYSEEAGFFDQAELKLLRELTGDISFALEHIGASEKLEYLARNDALTGLANSTLFHERLAQHVAAANAARGGLAVYIIDLERFKAINDAFGRPAGDELLKQVAERLVGVTGEPDRFARVGADRFAVVAPTVQTEHDAAHLAEQRLAQCFGLPFAVGASEVKLSIKFGVAVFPRDGADAQSLFRNAEAALKKAKASGERFLFYARQMTERTTANLALENHLRQALEQDQFVLHYQPKVDVEHRRIVGLEALIRWQSPGLGLVAPARFIPLLEETGLILEVGSWALRRAAADHRGWTEAGLKPPRVAVNVSAIQLRQRDFVGVVEQAIIGGVAPTGIDLEITESLIMQDVEATIGKLQHLRKLGIRIAIDDFGTGYSSLAYLAKLPVQTLKIDRSFIIRMLEDANTTMLVQTVISLAQSLRLKVVAEGVDAEDQAKMLRLLRCDEMQGFLFFRPLPLAEITALLRDPQQRA
jgi:diguanylate cyclase (GGDEF)-like protein